MRLDPTPIPRPPTADPLRTQAQEAMRRALENLARRQEDRGSWSGDYGGPMFLLPMYLALKHLANSPLDPKRAESMKRYFFNVQRNDGSIGLHSEATSGSMFCTALSYVGLRLLGAPANDPKVTAMREWVRANGTPLGAAAWGKFTLCVLGLYEWSGIHPVLPELWLLPVSAPMHPSRLWCHCRQVYLPMSWLYGTRATGPTSSLIEQLRDELYGEGEYARIDWEEQRDNVCAADDFRPASAALKVVNKSQVGFEKFPLKPLRKKALDECLKQIVYEDQVTNDIDIGPVNAVLNKMVHLFRGAEGAADLKRGLEVLDVYLWDAADGTKMQGYNNSELWDAAFAIQAILSVPALCDANAPMLEKAFGYLRDNQILDDVPDAEAHYRHASRGGWPFSNRAHGWPITDCTSEGLKCALALEHRFSPGISDDLLRSSVRLILSWQNADGGWATYEKKRGGEWLEQLNPSQVFGEIMVDYSYVECTSACIQALAKAKRRFPGEFDESIDRSIAQGVAFIQSCQQKDGSYEGSWAVCFTYGTWFAISGLRAAGVSATHPSVANGVKFLLGKQRPDGSWGEHGDSCRERRYLDTDGTVVQTSWALLSLVRAGCADREAMQCAAQFLISKQAADGSYAKEPLVGVFNKTCLIDYDNYRFYFPLWALGEWSAAAA